MADLDIQISIEDTGWPAEDVLHALGERVLGAAVTYLREEEQQPFPKMPPEVSLVFTDDASIQDINAEWRGKDKPTNVLSFPAFPVKPNLASNRHRPRREYGLADTEYAPTHDGSRNNGNRQSPSQATSRSAAHYSNSHTRGR